MKFYKITNQEEIEYDSRFYTGLNVIDKPFQPEKATESSGISFSKEDILAFIDYGYWIREVTLIEGEPLYESPDKPKQYRAPKVRLGERIIISPKVIEELIKSGADVHAGGNKALDWFVTEANMPAVEVLLKSGADMHVNNDGVIRWAACRNNFPMVKLLLKYGANINADHVAILRWAAYYGNLAAIKFLLKKGADGDVACAHMRNSADYNGLKTLRKIMEELR